MRKLVAAAGVVATTAFLALTFWQSATDAAGTRIKPDYLVPGASYLPIQKLEPVY